MKMRRKHYSSALFSLLRPLFLIAPLLYAGAAHAESTTPTAAPSGAVQMTVLLALASLIPAIVLTCTCFARFVIVFSFLKTVLGTSGSPPNQVLVGLALFMTTFVM